MPATGIRLSDLLKSWPLALLPHQLLSRVVRRITRCKQPQLKNFLVKRFISMFDVDMTQASQPDPTAFPDFNAFFTRALREDARPLPESPDAIACPVDGRVSACGPIEDDLIFQAKGHRYSLTRLLGGAEQHAQPFRNGQFATLYLSPRDYHRIHMPCAGQLRETVYVPGRLYSVAPHTVRAIDGLFARNERLVTFFDTDTGPMAIVMVGAIFVSCMETAWDGVVNPKLGMQRTVSDYRAATVNPVSLARGEELGRFNMGSTVILLFGPGHANWDEQLSAGDPTRMGQSIGQFLRK